MLLRLEISGTEEWLEINRRNTFRNLHGGGRVKRMSVEFTISSTTSLTNRPHCTCYIKSNKSTRYYSVNTLNVLRKFDLLISLLPLIINSITYTHTYDLVSSERKGGSGVEFFPWHMALHTTAFTISLLLLEFNCSGAVWGRKANLSSNWSAFHASQWILSLCSA